MITLNNLGKAYKNNIVLDIAELSIPKGEIFGLVGNNGAGKTTMFRLLLDLIKADKGQVTHNGQNIAITERWKDYTASYLDEGFLLDFLTPTEYFQFIGSCYSLPKEETNNRVNNYNSFLTNEILASPKKYIRDFSRGNKQKIGITGALITEPQILILDEPFNSLDPSSQITLKKILKEYNAHTGATILISSHDLNHVTEICQRIVLLEKGKIIRDLINDGTALKQLEKYFGIEQETVFAFR